MLFQGTKVTVRDLNFKVENKTVLKFWLLFKFGDNAYRKKFLGKKFKVRILIDNIFFFKEFSQIFFITLSE